MGRKMERYFEIQSLDEIASGVPQSDESSAPAPQLGEIADEEEATSPIQESVKKKV